MATIEFLRKLPNFPLELPMLMHEFAGVEWDRPRTQLRNSIALFRY